MIRCHAVFLRSNSLSPRRSRFVAVLFRCGICFGALACSDVERADAGRGANDALSRGARLESLSTVLPPRPQVLALAQEIESLALLEGAGARALQFHALAAGLYERMWRTEHRSQDADEALDLYRAAGHTLDLPGACEAAVRFAMLSGELAKDARRTYAELYRVQRRAPGSDGGTNFCAAAVDVPLASLAAFRPGLQVLEAIDQGLAGEGAIALALASYDGGLLRTRSAPRITRIEQWAGPEAARVVVHLDRVVPFRTGDSPSRDGRGARTYIELDGVELGVLPRETTGESADLRLVSKVVAESTTTGSRVALDLEGRAYRRVFTLLEPFRVVVDIARHPPGSGSSGSGRSVVRVVLDPGHGGSDPGAIGPSGLKEKDVTLAVAHRVAPVLARAGVAITLTRDDDTFVSLEERTARANAYGADLFVSIHCNAAENRARKGVETYVLDTTASEMAGKVAARENGASAGASNEVAQLLASMRLADQATRSTHLAELLQRAGSASLASRYENVVNGGVHRAGFYVLVGARMPAVLLETSYISNAVEEQRLGSADYQQRLADAIANAIKAYREGL